MWTDLFAKYLFSLAGLAILLPFLLAFTSIALILRLSRRKIWKWLKLAIAVVCAAILSVFLFLAVVSLYNRLENGAVRNYVARRVPILDKIKGRTGSYPAELPLSILGEPPNLLKLYGDYSSDGKTFRFEYVNEPAGWAGGAGALEFESFDRRWKYER